MKYTLLITILLLCSVMGCMADGIRAVVIATPDDLCFAYCLDTHSIEEHNVPKGGYNIETGRVYCHCNWTGVSK